MKTDIKVWSGGSQREERWDGVVEAFIQLMAQRQAAVTINMENLAKEFDDAMHGLISWADGYDAVACESIGLALIRRTAREMPVFRENPERLLDLTVMSLDCHQAFDAMVRAVAGDGPQRSVRGEVGWETQFLSGAEWVAYARGLSCEIPKSVRELLLSASNEVEIEKQLRQLDAIVPTRPNS